MSGKPLLSRAGAKPGSLGLSGTAGLQLKPAAGKPLLGRGLSLGGKKKPGLAKPVGAAASAFGALDDDLDEESERARVSRELQHGSSGGYAGSALNRAAIEAAKQEALDQDASTFDYDDVYDDMQQERSALRAGAVAAKTKEVKTSKYITSIMEAHKGREIENEKLFERRMVKEAEAEAHLYGDKERFMTSAYKRKLEEREDYEAELKRKEAEEAKNDVTKRAGLGDFYSNLLHGNVGGGGGGGRGSGSGGGSGGAADEAARDGGCCSSSTGSAGESSAADGDGVPDRTAPPASSSCGSGSGLIQVGLADSISQAVGAMGRVQAAEAAAPPAPAAAASAPERRNDGEAVMSARERYLARKKQRDEAGPGLSRSDPSA